MKAEGHRHHRSPPAKLDRRCHGRDSARSNRQVGAIADRLLEDLEKAGVPNLRVEGMPHCDWVLIDAGDVIIHVFRPEVRAFYNLEKMWASARPRGRQAI